jgi:ubiquitin carboxyl-terminal hydrolase 1
MNATLRRLTQEAQSLSEVENPSTSKKRRLRDVKKMVAKVKSALEEGRIEDELKDVRMEKVISLSTKQAMIARVSSASKTLR